MGLWVVVAIAAASWAFGFGSGWTVDTWKQGAAHAKELQAAQHDLALAEAAASQVRAERDRIADTFLGKLAGLRPIYRTINNEVRHELEKTVYGDPNCAVPATGVGLLNAAIDAANGKARPDPVKPPATVPGNPEVRRVDPAPARRSIPGAQGFGDAIRGVRPLQASVDRRDEGNPALAALNLTD